MDKQIEVEGADIFFEDNKYIRVVFKPKVSIDLKLAQGITQAIGNELFNVKHGNIVDTTHLHFITSEARKHFAAQNNPSVAGVALVVKSSIQAAFANLYFKFTQQAIETKMFSNVQEAKEWIDTKL